MYDDDVARWECSWSMRLVFAFAKYVPLYQQSLRISVLRWLAAHYSAATISVIQPEGVAVLLQCVSVIPYSVLLEPAIVTLLTHHHVTSAIFFYKLREVPFCALSVENVRCLMYAGCGRPEWDEFVWTMCFGPGILSEIHGVLLTDHPPCDDVTHWCHCLRLHSGLMYHDAPLPNAQPLQRFLSRHAQPGDLTSALNLLLDDDNKWVQRWIAMSFGYQDNIAHAMPIPRETVACHVIGSVVQMAYTVGVCEPLSVALQDYIASLLLHVGYTPHSAARLLRMLIFHADDTHLCVACQRWWRKHGPMVIPSLFQMVTMLSPCIGKLTERCATILPNKCDGAGELEGPRSFLPFDRCKRDSALGC
jgi:hypothetical protein